MKFTSYNKYLPRLEAELAYLLYNKPRPSRSSYLLVNPNGLITTNDDEGRSEPFAWLDSITRRPPTGVYKASIDRLLTLTGYNPKNISMPDIRLDILDEIVNRVEYNWFMVQNNIVYAFDTLHLRNAFTFGEITLSKDFNYAPNSSPIDSLVYREDILKTLRGKPMNDEYRIPCERPEHLKVTDFLANEIKIRKDKLVALNEEIKHLQASVDAIRNSMS